MNMEFPDAISSFRATPWRKFIGILETGARRIKSAGRPSSAVRSSSSCKPDSTVNNTLRTQGVSASIVRSMARDITERRRADHSLRLFRALIDRSSDAIEVIDPNTQRFFDCNESAYHDLGYSREEFLSLSVYDIDPLFAERMARLTEEMDRSGFVIFESIHRRKDGSTFPVEVNLKTVRLERDYRLAVVRDITERKVAEEALRQAEQKYRRIFENASEGIFQSTPDGKLIAANPALAVMYGFDSPEEMIRSCNDISQQMYVDSTRREEFRNLIERHGVVRDFEYQAFKKDGSKLWISLNARVVRDDEGAIRHYEGTAQDISERKLQEEALHESETLLKQSQRVAVLGHYVFDVATGFWTSSEVLDEIFGIDVAYTKNVEGWLDIVHPEQRDEMYAYLRDQVLKERNSFDSEYRIVRINDSAVRWVHGLGNLEFNTEGQLARIFGVVQDITERKRAEAALRESEERFAKAFHASPAALSVVLLEDGRLLEVNDAFLRMTGYQRGEVIGRSTLGLGLWHDSNQRITMAGLLRERGTVTDLEIIFRKQSGEVRNGLLSVDLIELSGEPCVLGIAQDITERKRAEAALRNYSRLLIEAQEAERQNIARELHDQTGQVLTAIRINLQTIRKSSETGESRLLIDEGMGMVDQTLKQIRNLSFELRPSLLDDLGLTAALRRYADRYAQRTGIQTKTSICPESRSRLPRELETACFRIVQEALTNVARHAQAKNVSIDVRTMNGNLSLSIKDDGIGFDLHSQKNGELLSSLGLRGMEERAHGLGGKLEIKSAPREGTEVRVHFPKETKREGLT